jgi:DNA polymerase-3 subunit gamma/tau
MKEELYKKHRPTSFKEVVGQDAAIRMLVGFGKQKAIPHAILFAGPSGCGKTTIGRILRTKLKCSDHDFHEMDNADLRGIDVVRDIKARVGLSPMGGKSRVWLIDEAHKLTGDAQGALLKILEDTPSHVYFMLATTDPDKLLKTIRTRCTLILTKLLNPKDMGKLLTDIAGKEDFSLSDEVRDKIIEGAEGSPRKGLVLLNSIMGVEGEDNQLEVIEKAGAKEEGIALCRALLKDTPWQGVVKILKGLEEEPESIRRMVLGYASTVMMGSPKVAAKAYLIFDSFRESFFYTGKAGLIGACYEVVNGGNSD